MLSKAVDGRNQVLVGVGLQDVPTRAGLQHVACKFFRTMHRQHQHFGVGRVFEDLPGGIEAVQLRQAQIHHDDVGPKSPALFDRVAPCRGLAADFPAFLAFKERADASPHDRVIVNDEDAQGHQPASFTSGTRARTIVP